MLLFVSPYYLCLMTPDNVLNSHTSNILIILRTVQNFLVGMLNLFTAFLLNKSIISPGRSSHLKMRNSSITPCKGFWTFELPRFAHFHCAGAELFALGTSERLGVVALVSSFARVPLIYSRALPSEARYVPAMWYHLLLSRVVSVRNMDALNFSPLLVLMVLDPRALY